MEATVLQGALKESRQRLCKKILLETVVCSSWQSLEVRRIVRETKEGGLYSSTDRGREMPRKYVEEEGETPESMEVRSGG